MVASTGGYCSVTFLYLSLFVMILPIYRNNKREWKWLPCSQWKPWYPGAQSHPPSPARHTPPFSQSQRSVQPGPYMPTPHGASQSSPYQPEPHTQPAARRKWALVVLNPRKHNMGVCQYWLLTWRKLLKHFKNHLVQVKSLEMHPKNNSGNSKHVLTEKNMPYKEPTLNRKHTWSPLKHIQSPCTQKQMHKWKKHL